MTVTGVPTVALELFVKPLNPDVLFWVTPPENVRALSPETVNVVLPELPLNTKALESCTVPPSDADAAPIGCGVTTALHAARCGLKALVVSADPAHSLADCLGVPVGAEPIEIPDGTGDPEPAPVEKWALDRFGVRKVYPTVSGGREWFLPGTAPAPVTA